MKFGQYSILLSLNRNKHGARRLSFVASEEQTLLSDPYEVLPNLSLKRSGASGVLVNPFLPTGPNSPFTSRLQPISFLYSIGPHVERYRPPGLRVLWLDLVKMPIQGSIFVSLCFYFFTNLSLSVCNKLVLQEVRF